MFAYVALSLLLLLAPSGRTLWKRLTREPPIRPRNRVDPVHVPQPPAPWTPVTPRRYRRRVRRYPRRARIAAGPITSSALTADGSVVLGSTFTTAAVAMPIDKLTVIWIFNGVVSGTAGTPTVYRTGAGSSNTWTQIFTINDATFGANRRLSAFYRPGTNTDSDTITIDFGGANQAECQWCVADYAGVKLTNSRADGIGQTATNTQNATATVFAKLASGPADAVNNLVIAGMAIAHTPQGFTPVSGYSVDQHPAPVSATNSLTTFTRTTLTGVDARPAGTPAAAARSAIGVIELVADAATITATVLLTESSATTANNYVTSSITAKAGLLTILSVYNTKAGTPDTPTVTGASLTWTQVNTVGVSTRRQTWFRSVGAGTGALTIDFAGLNQTGCDWMIIQIAGTALGGANGAEAIVQTVTGNESGQSFVSSTLAAFKSTANAVLSTVGGASASNQWLYPPDGHGQITNINVGSFAFPQAFSLAWPNHNYTGPTWTSWDASGAFVMAMVTISAELAIARPRGELLILQSVKRAAIH